MVAEKPLLSVSISAQYEHSPWVLEQAEFQMARGEILGLAGQSGCGKSTLALAIPGLLKFKGGKARGSISFNDTNLLSLTEPALRAIRGKKISLVLQSPYSSLNPRLRIQSQLREAWRAHRDGDGEAEIAEALGSVSLPTTREFLRRLPAELSLGQAQRVLIAIAILHRPELVIADEPTSALDPITANDILRLFRHLNRQLRIAVLLISHDLLSMAAIADRIAVLHQGSVIECGDVERIFSRPQHPYTAALVAAVSCRPPAVRDRQPSLS